MALEHKENLTGKTPRKSASRLTAKQLATVTTAPAVKPQPAPTQTFNRLTPTRDQIAQRAYELWLARGCAHGNDIGDWLEAERQLSQQ
jgi:hypothetical protein